MTVIKRIILDVTSKCNLQCPMCWGPPRKFDISKNKYIDNELSLSEIKKILEFMKINFGSSVLTINGGEPLIRTDLLEILALLQSSKNQRNKIQHSFNVMNCQHNHKLFHLSPVISCV